MPGETGPATSKDSIMGASLLVSVFLAFSLSLSWFSGDQEKGILEDTLQETVAKQKAINEEYMLLTIKMREKEASRKALEAKLKKELKKQQELKRSLVMEKRRLRQAVESGTAIDLEGEREKIRQEVEDRANKEIAKLEQKIAAIEAEKKRIEAEARKKLMAKKEQDAEAWRQAEKAKARAREAIIKYKALKTTLKTLKEAKEKAENILRIQAMARKRAEEALQKEKANRAALEARLKAVEEALRLTALPGGDKSVKKAASDLVAEMEKARQMLREQINEENKAISRMEKGPDINDQLAKIELDSKEKEALRNKLEEKVHRIAELERELRLSKTREQELRANIEKKTTTAEAENASSPVDKDKIDTLRARIMSLEAKLHEVEEKKKAFAEQARARIDELTRKAQHLETRNREQDKNKGAEEARPLKANTPEPGTKAYPQITNTNTPNSGPGLFEMQTKLENKDLLDLRGQASSYVAQKMIDRNMELEAQLQETRLQLAQARSAYRNARSGGLGAGDDLGSDTRTIIARYRQAATTITALNQRNIELEAQATEKERALAEAEAARFIIAKLQEQNIELMKRLRELEAARMADKARAAEKAKEKTETVAAAPAKDAAAPEAAADNTEKTAETVKAQVAAKTSPEPAKAETPARAKTEKAVNTAAVKEEAAPEKTASPAASLVVPGAAAEAAPSDEALLFPASLTETPVRAPLLTAGAETLAGTRPAVSAAAEPAAPSVRQALREERAKALREIVNKIQDMNLALEEAEKNPGPESLSFVQIHEELRKLRKSIMRKIANKVITLDDVTPYLENSEGEFTFYILKKNETPEDIAARDDVYGDPSLWPLIYRYNQSSIERPDVFETTRLLIIYKNLPDAEKQEAMEKARKLGQWKTWTKEARRTWIEDWIM